MRRLARDTAWLIVERAVRLALGLSVGIYCARVLGPADYGLYSYALSLVTLFAFLGQAGLEGILVRELVRAERDEASTISAAFLLRIGGSVLAWLAAFALAWSSDGELPATPLVALIAIGGVLQSAWVMEAWLHAKKDFGASVVAKSTGVLISAVLRVIAVHSDYPLYALAVVSTIESLLIALLLCAAAARRGLAPTALLRLPRMQAVSEIWHDSRRMLLASMAIAIYARIDVFMLGQMKGQVEVGLYSAAMTISEGFYAIPVALMSAASPRLASLFLQDRREFVQRSGQLIRLCSWLGLLLAASLTLLAEPAIRLTYGEGFLAASPMLAIHIWSTWLVFVSSASEPWFIQHGLFGRYLGKTVIAAIGNIALNLVLIPRYGGIGAALATLISYALSAVACNALWSDTRPLLELQLSSMFGFGSAGASPRNE